MKTRKLVDTLVVLFFLSACSLEEGNGPASFTLKMPESFNKSSNVSTMGANSCFAVSLSGEALPSTPAGECDPEFGQFVGLVSAGQSVTFEVEKGEGRTLDIYYVNNPNGCQDFEPTAGLGKTFGSNKVYRIAHMPDLNIDQSDMEIHVHVQYPSTTNTIAAIENSPASCLINNVPPFASHSHRSSQAAGLYNVPGTNSKLKLRITDKHLDVSVPGSDRILPTGVEL